MINPSGENYIFKVENDTPLGRACFAKVNIQEGEIICKMTGPLISLREFSEKYPFDNGNPLQVDEDVYLDLIEPFVCFNHSCDPNAGIRNNGVLFALREIKKGEEIRYDYSTTVDDHWWGMDCLCQSPICRQKISDFQSISHDRKSFYKEKGALTAHLLRVYY